MGSNSIPLAVKAATDSWILLTEKAKCLKPQDSGLEGLAGEFGNEKSSMI